ncbi:hypothetical protein EDD15DRAFT_969592 [Pisolithus albus]|nr:hypothetical protein EDD15DRAFT_969592 [Pisolithus albus]
MHSVCGLACFRRFYSLALLFMPMLLNTVIDQVIYVMHWFSTYLVFCTSARQPCLGSWDMSLREFYYSRKGPSRHGINAFDRGRRRWWSKARSLSGPRTQVFFFWWDC